MVVNSDAKTYFKNNERLADTILKLGSILGRQNVPTESYDRSRLGEGYRHSK